MDPLSTSPQSTPPPHKQNMLSPIFQSVLPKQSRSQHTLTPDSLLYTSKLRSRDQPILRQPRKTKPIVWFAAILCMIFIVVVIFLGIATLIVYITVQPRNPSFDAPSATINAVYFNPPQFINGEVTFLANISNPNRRLSARFEHLHVELYFSESLIATQVLVPFSERPRESRLVSVRLVWGSVFLPPDLVVDILEQAQRNRVVYNLKGAFRVRVKTGLIHYSYWMHLDCQLEMTSPPNSVLALSKKGVSEVDTQKAIKQVFEGEESEDQESGITMSKLSLDQLYVQASKQWQRSRGSPQETRKSRMVRWLQYRGFNWSVTNYVLKKLGSENPS